MEQEGALNQVTTRSRSRAFGNDLTNQQQHGQNGRKLKRPLSSIEDDCGEKEDGPRKRRKIVAVSKNKRFVNTDAEGNGTTHEQHQQRGGGEGGPNGERDDEDMAGAAPPTRKVTTSRSTTVSSHPHSQQQQQQQQQHESGSEEQQKLKKKHKMLPCDKHNLKNDLACVEYIEDIMRYFLSRNKGINDYMKEQRFISSRMRCILLDWVIEVHQKFKLRPSTLYTTIHMLDCTLSSGTGKDKDKEQNKEENKDKEKNKGFVVEKHNLQLLGATCLWMSCKYQEIYAPAMDDFVYISDYAFKIEDMIEFEAKIVDALNFELSFVTPYNFLERFMTVVTHNMKPEHAQVTTNLMEYILGNCLLNYDLARLEPALLSSAVVAFSLFSLVKTFRWSDTFVRVTNYTLEQLRDVILCIRDLLNKVNCDKNLHKGLKRKYSHKRWSKVAHLKLHPVNV